MAMKRALLAFVAMAAIVELALAANYTVGDSNGWSLGVNYTQWASSISNFLPGDFIIFNYDGSAHSVLEVTSSDFAKCNTGNPLSTSNSGDTAIALTADGPRFFICGIPGHCSAGMQVAISVLPPTTPPSPSPSPAPAPVLAK